MPCATSVVPVVLQAVRKKTLSASITSAKRRRLQMGNVNFVMARLTETEDKLSAQSIKLKFSNTVINGCQQHSSPYELECCFLRSERAVRAHIYDRSWRTAERCLHVQRCAPPVIHRSGCRRRNAAPIPC